MRAIGQLDGTIELVSLPLCVLQMSDKKPDSVVWKAAKPFVNGGLSGMGATCIIQPIDMVKVRIQIGAQGGPVCQLLCCTSATLHALLA